MNNKEKKKYTIFIFFAFIQVILETLSLGSLYPLFLMIFSNDTDLINNSIPFINSVKNYLSINSDIFNISIIIFFLFLAKNLFLTFLIHWSQNLERSVKIRLKNLLLKIYINKDYIFHLNKVTAKLVRNINTSTDTILMSVRNSMILINEILLFIFLLILMTSINFKMVVYCLAIVLLPIIIFGPFFKKIIVNWGGFSFDHQGESLKRLLQSLSMIKEIKIFNKEKYFMNFFNIEETNFQNFQKKLFIIKSYPKLFFEMVFILGILFFLNFKFLSVETSSTQDILPSLAILSLIAIRIFPSLNKIIYSIQKQNHYQKSIDAVSEDIKNGLDKSIISNDLNINYDFKKIYLKNVSFQYKENDKFIFKDFNFEIYRNEHIGLVGESGSGKSTLIDIILGLLTPKTGKITLDDKVVDTKSEQWIDLFGYVPQTINLFNDSLFANITLEDQIDKIDTKKVNEVIEKCGLSKFVKKLNNGLETNVGEQGLKISGGERQRIGIARALYKNPEIIIFDESFNSLDKFSKDNLFNVLNEISKSKTIINVSHNFEDLKNCDKIINLNELNKK